jgi:hypothetical protein
LEREKNESVFFTPLSREHHETAGIRYTWARNFIFLFFFRKKICSINQRHVPRGEKVGITPIELQIINANAGRLADWLVG